MWLARTREPRSRDRHTQVDRHRQIVRMAVDSSALNESERERFIAVLLENQPVISIASLTETSLVLLGCRGAAALDELDRQLAGFRCEIAPVLADNRMGLRQALLEFGKGRRRAPAVLNFSALFAYALAKRLNLPLLYKGDDFARTDVEPVPL
jgi:ribonuclease VapC